MNNPLIDTTLAAQVTSREINTVMWEQLSDRVDAFCATWDKDPPPAIATFIPNDNPILRRFVLVELIKVDLEYRWLKHDMPKLVEEYIAEFLELVRDGKHAIDLIYEELHVRKQTEQPPSIKSLLRTVSGLNGKHFTIDERRNKPHYFHDGYRSQRNLFTNRA